MLSVWMMRESTIKPGDKFSRVENPRTVWVVVREEVMTQDMPPHFQLAHAMTRSRTILIAASALLDKNLFKRVED